MAFTQQLIQLQAWPLQTRQKINSTSLTSLLLPTQRQFFFNFITYCISTLSCKYLSLPNLIFIKQSKDYFQKLLQIKFQFYKDLFYYVPKEVSIGIFAYNAGN